MTRKPYEHSAYWYAYHYGWTYSEAKTYAGKYLDMHTYRPRMREVREGESYGKAWFAWRNQNYEFDSTFNPLLLGACAMVDIGIAMRDTAARLADPKERDRMRRELVRDLRALRRPFYYAREKARRRELAAARRKITRRTTTAPMPTPEALLAAWNARKDSREAMVRLGGMLHDLACYVDSCLRFDESGNVAGRNGGIKEWLRENLPELSTKYKTLMRYKAMAMRLRQATGTKDPKPTAALLDEMPRHELVATILATKRPSSRVFSPRLSTHSRPRPSSSTRQEPSRIFRMKFLKAAARGPCRWTKSHGGIFAQEVPAEYNALRNNDRSGLQPAVQEFRQLKGCLGSGLLHKSLEKKPTCFYQKSARTRGGNRGPMAASFP